MRTTVDLPEDLHRQAMSIARDRGETLSQTIATLMRRALGEGQPVEIIRHPTTGLPIVRMGMAVTVDDVRALDDDE